MSSRGNLPRLNGVVERQKAPAANVYPQGELFAVNKLITALLAHNKDRGICSCLWGSAGLQPGILERRFAVGSPCRIIALRGRGFSRDIATRIKRGLAGEDPFVAQVAPPKLFQRET